jgi:hypothetical protein
VKILSFAVAFFCFFALKAQKELEPKIGYTPAIDELSIQRAKAKDQQLAKLNARIEKGLKREQMTKAEQSLLDNVNPMEDASDPWSLDSGGCSWYCGATVKDIRASSVLKPQGENTYGAKNAHDFTLNHAWVEGVSGYGIGEYIEYVFPKNNPTVTTVEIFNGYVKSEKAWLENSRIKKLKMYVNGKPYAILNLKDTKAQQRFDIGKLKNATADLVIRFEIIDVYKGTKWGDTVLSELEFDGTDVHCFVAETKVTMADGSQRAIRDIMKGDKVLTYNFDMHQVEEAEVLETDNRKHHNLVEYDFGDFRLVGTEDHPMYAINGGWSSLQPLNSQQYVLHVDELTKGSKLLGVNIKGGIAAFTIVGFKKLSLCAQTYTIVKLSKNNSFFADRILVSAEDVSALSQ